MLKLCLIPTTGNALKKFDEIYSDSFDLSWVFLSPYCLDREQCNFFHKSALAQLIWHSSKLVRLPSLYIGLTFLRSDIRRFIKSNAFDCVVVSNDCGLIQGLFVEEANRIGVPTVAHQVASATVPADVSTRIKLKRMLKQVLGFPRNIGYGRNSKNTILLGAGWGRDLGLKHFYRYNHNWKDLDRYREAIYARGLDKQSFLFVGQPLAEINLLSKKQAEAHYALIDGVLASLNKGGVCARYKPHPQETAHRKFEWPLEKSDPLTALAAYDIFVSFSSTMNLDAKLMGKLSLRFDPLFISEIYKRQCSHYFHGSIVFQGKQFEIKPIEDWKDDYYCKSDGTIIEIYEDIIQRRVD